MTTTEHADQPAELPATTAKPSLVFPKMWVLFGVLICCFTAWGGGGPHHSNGGGL
jgi:FHS family L-fucose permease-like MFS transporter